MQTYHGGRVVAVIIFIFLLVSVPSIDAADTVVNFDSPAPSGSSGSYLSGTFQAINFGSRQWRWENSSGPNTTKHIYFTSSAGTSRAFTFNPAPQILSALTVFANTAGTLTMKGISS